MTAPDPVDALRAELAALRRDNRRHALLTFAALLAAALSVAYAHQLAGRVRVTDGVIEARGFVVTDGSGESVATLGLVEVVPDRKIPALEVRTADGDGSVTVVAPYRSHRLTAGWGLCW